MAYSLKWGSDFLCIQFNGVLEIDDIINANSDFFGNENFDHIKYIVWDTTQIDSANVDKFAVRIGSKFAVSLNRYHSHLKVALIAKDELLKKLIAEYIAQTLLTVPSAQQKLFDNMNDAITWASN